MAPFNTIEAAAEFVKAAPLAGNVFELAMADGYTLNGQADRPMGKFSLGMIQIGALLVGRDFKPDGQEQREGFCVFRFSRIRMSTAAEVPFPTGFKPQGVRLPNAAAICSDPPPDIVRFFEDHPAAADDLIGESGDKRYAPSTFIMKTQGGWRVGWFSIADGMQSIQASANKSDAVTDYLLFSLGIGRWNGKEMVARDARS